MSERARKLEAELAELTELLDQPERRLPLIDRIRVASPCKESWDDMVGDDHVRHCARCDKNVYNLSALPADEAELLLFEKEGKLCVRYFRRPDGTILTSDCPVGRRKQRVRRLAFAALGAGALAAAGGAISGAMVMGEVEVVGKLESVPVMGE